MPNSKISAFAHLAYSDAHGRNRGEFYRISGHICRAWRNPGGHPLSRIWLHLVRLGKNRKLLHAESVGAAGPAARLHNSIIGLYVPKSAPGGAGDHAQHGGGGIGNSRYFAGPLDNRRTWSSSRYNIQTGQI